MPLTQPRLLPCSDRTDVMACCRGDYGLFYRLAAGWVGQGGRGGERVVLGAADLAAPAQRRFTLWPFDRRGPAVGKWGKEEERAGRTAGGSSSVAGLRPTSRPGWVAQAQAFTSCVKCPPPCRPESRGNLLALTIRRSADEVLVIGYRSAPHWQARVRASHRQHCCRAARCCSPLLQPADLDDAAAVDVASL